ncbi:MAG TPA: acyl-CoA dehydrogenase family protein [Candidatus Acidoferrales bacterium]|nr:acyl-CoA dehydrogenase family protein [Candidatus Acidoferrales bacterium]
MATAVTQKQIRGGSFLVEDRAPADVFIPEDFNEEQRQIAQMTEEFATKEVLARADELEHQKEGLMAELLRKAAELGLLGADVPEAYGGSGLGKVATTIISEKIARYASFAVSHGGHHGIGTLPIAYFGTEAQKKKYLPKLASGELISCYCLSEAEAGSDALAAKTRAELSPDGKHWILNGQKMWITNGGFADVFIVFAKVDGEKFSCFIVERGTPGFSVGAEEKKMGIKGSSTVPLFFDTAKIPAENLLHEIGRGHIVAFNILNVGRFKLAAYCIGGGKYSLAHALRYAQERKAFGKAIAEFGLIQHKLAEMAIRLYAGESMIYRTAGMIDAALEGVDLSAADAPQHAMKALEEYAVECSINKVCASEILDYVVDEFVQILGGYGYHQDYPAERAYRDARINRIFEGTNEINRLLITGMLFKRATKGVLPLMAAAKKVADELMAGPSLPAAAAATELLVAETAGVAASKKAFLFAAGVAVQKYMDKLADEQEVAAALSDMVMDTYAMESVLLRTKKILAGKGADGARIQVAATQVFLGDALDRVEKNARTVLAASASGDTLRTYLALLRRVLKREPLDAVALRRQVARAALAANRYPF